MKTRFTGGSGSSARGGGEGGRTTLLDRLCENYPRVFAFFVSRGFSADESRDLTQETLLRGILHIANLRNAAAVEKWLLRIAANIWKNRIRDTNATPSSPQGISTGEPELDGAAAFETLPDGAPSPLEDLIELERLAAMAACLVSLGPKLRRSLLLYVDQELTYQEIADLLEIPMSRVKSRIHGAKKALSKCVAKRLGQERP